jgi:hypothetical protein
MISIQDRFFEVWTLWLLLLSARRNPCGPDDRDAMRALPEDILEQIAKQLHCHVFERQRRAVRKA